MPVWRTNIMTTSNDNKLIQSIAENYNEVTSADLPLSCPMPGMSQWNSHPKVYIPIEETGEGMCPYCSASFKLKG
jgi:uncharacterized Zn-finger protein